MDLLSEEEQWERLKAWVRTNGVSVLGLTAVLLLAWFGWKWWQERGEKESLAAGAVYQNVLNTFDSGRRDEALALIETLRREHPESIYVAAADMVAANVHVEQNELDKAAERLQRVANGAPDEYLRPIARLRLARVQLAQGLHDAALATLGTAALKEYQAAREQLPAVELESGGVGELLDLKIADLAGPALAGAPTPGAPAGEPAAAAEPAAAEPAAATTP